MKKINKMMLLGLCAQVYTAQAALDFEVLDKNIASLVAASKNVFAKLSEKNKELTAKTTALAAEKDTATQEAENAKQQLSTVETEVSAQIQKSVQAVQKAIDMINAEEKGLSEASGADLEVSEAESTDEEDIKQ